MSVTSPVLRKRKRKRDDSDEENSEDLMQMQITEEKFEKLVSGTPNAIDNMKYFILVEGRIFCRVCMGRSQRDGTVGRYSSTGALPEYTSQLNQHLERSNLHLKNLVIFEKEYKVFVS